jgi:hypothetical protein
VVLAGVLCLVLPAQSAGASASSIKIDWSWSASGQLGRDVSCVGFESHSSKTACEFSFASAPGTDVVHETVTFSNQNAITTCYGIAISTSYMAGLNSLCVKGHSSLQFKNQGNARHFKDTSLSVFVTSGSTSRPIDAIPDRGRTTFTVVFSESQNPSLLPFAVYAPHYFAGFKFSAFTLGDPSLCTDAATRVFALGGVGTFANQQPGVSIFEKATGTCTESRGFNTLVSTLTINGHRAQLWSNCAGLAVGACGPAQIRTNGGLVMWSIPGSGRYRATQVRVTSYNLSLPTLLSVARSVR